MGVVSGRSVLGGTWEKKDYSKYSYKISILLHHFGIRIEKRGQKERSWPNTTPRKDEKKKRRSNNSLPSTSAKSNCEAKTKGMKVEYDHGIWSPLFGFPLYQRVVPL